jgi:hypothetical protein
LPRWRPPCNAETTAPKPAQIDRNGVIILIRTTLLALDQANKTGNYTVLRDIGAPGFQTNTAARLGDIFAKLRNDNLDLSGVAAIDPQLNLLPQRGKWPDVYGWLLSLCAEPGQFRPPEPSPAQTQPAANGAKQPATAKSAPTIKPGPPEH